MPDITSHGHLPRHVQDLDTQPGSSSTELQLRHQITHSPLPVETALTEMMRQSSDAIRHAASPGEAGEPALTQEQIASIQVLPDAASGQLHGRDTTPSDLDRSLQALQQRYYSEDKHPRFDDDAVLAYARESHAQRAKPAAQQDWQPAHALWCSAQIDRLPYDRRSGDMAASQIYVGTANLGSLLTAIPAFMTLAAKRSDLKDHAVAKAAENFGVQGGLVGVTPLVMAFLRVMLLPAMENVRQGSPMRSKEMKTRDLATIVGDMRTTEEAMQKLTTDMKAALAELHGLTERDESPSQALVTRYAALSERMLAHSQKVNALSEEYAAKGRTDSLNDVFTTWRTRVGMLQVGSNFLAGVVGVATKDPKLAAGVQIGGAALAMLWNQGLSAPYHVLFGKGKAPSHLVGAGVSDDVLKQDATIFATAASSNIVKPGSSHKTPQALTMADIDLADFKKQWKGPLGAGVAQVEEYLAFNIRMKEQQIDDLLGLEPGESKKLEVLEAVPESERSDPQNVQLDSINRRKTVLAPESDAHGRFVQLRHERDELKRQKDIVSAGEDWTKLSPEIKKVLHDAVVEGSFLASLRHTIRLGLVRMAQPSDFIPQVVQLVAAAVQLWLVAGRAFPLLAQAAFRLAGAPQVEQGKPSPVPDAARYVTSVLALGVGIWGVMSASHLIREKIAQRNEMRAAASEHGERFGKLQNLHYKNLAKASVNLFHAMHISVTGPLQQRRAATASLDVVREHEDSRRIFDELKEEIDRFHLIDL